jgi:hypothetical protein
VSQVSATTPDDTTAKPGKRSNGAYQRSRLPASEKRQLVRRAQKKVVAMEEKKADDPTSPEYWHKVANMTVLDLVTAVANFVKEKFNAVDLENTDRRDLQTDHRGDQRMEEEKKQGE